MCVQIDFNEELYAIFGIIFLYLLFLYMNGFSMIFKKWVIASYVQFFYEQNTNYFGNFCIGILIVISVLFIGDNYFYDVLFILFFILLFFFLKCVYVNFGYDWFFLCLVY